MTKKDPVFAEVKCLMTEIKTQLGELSQHQKQQRQDITQSGDELRSLWDSNGSQWNLEAKQKLIELAAQQKMLLHLYKRHKELVQWIQALKKKLQEASVHILPSVGMQRNAQNTANAATTTVTTIATGHLPFQSQSAVTMTTSCLRSTLLATSRISRPELAPSTANTSTCSQQIPSLQGSGPQNIPCGEQSHFSVNCSQGACVPSTTHPVIQKVTLTAGELYQIGGRQFYFLSQGQTQPKNLQGLAEPPVTHGTTVASNNLPVHCLSAEGNEQNKHISSGLRNLPFSAQTSTESSCASVSTNSAKVSCHTMSTTNSILKSAAAFTFCQPAICNDKPASNSLVSSSALTFLNSKPKNCVGIDQPKYCPALVSEPGRVHASCITKRSVSTRLASS